MIGLHRRPLLAISISVALLVAVAGGVLLMSVRVPPIFDFREDSRTALAEDESIRGTATFDRDSYLIGETARYRIRILWRPDRVSPDLEAFVRTVGLQPFDHRESETTERRVGASLREFRADFELQAVAIDSAASYTLPAPIVHYTAADEADANVHTLRVPAPAVYVGEYYPGDAATVPLRPPKPAVHERRGLRRALMAICAAGFGAVAAFLLWQQGRRRAESELSAAERCWRDVQSSASAQGMPAHARVDALEHLVMRALRLRTGLDPVAFWFGSAIDDAGQRELIGEARTLLETAYRPDGAEQVDTARLREIAEELLAPLVEEERLKRELENDPVERLRSQPIVLGAAAALAVLAVAALLLAALPSTWIASDVRRYNAAVALIEADTGLQPAVDAFSALAENAGHTRVRSASLYNLGTLLADPRMTRLSREQYRNFRESILLEDVTVGRLLHDLELDAEFELVTLLSELTRQHVRAEQALQAAVRSQPEDADAARNLEVVGKIRAAIGRSLAGLVANAEQDGGSQLAQTQTVIDLRLLMEAELPDDFARIDEGKDDSEYYIMERF